MSRVWLPALLSLDPVTPAGQVPGRMAGTIQAEYRRGSPAEGSPTRVISRVNGRTEDSGIWSAFAWWSGGQTLWEDEGLWFGIPEYPVRQETDPSEEESHWVDEGG